MELSGLATIYGNGSTKEILPKEITSHILRRGKWTVEEERYTEKIIMDFENGTLDVPEGTTLRTYLSKVLNCDPMRITKKYTGNSSIGKRTFTPLVRSPENIPFIELSQRELEDLRRSWISKLLLAEQWNHRKLSLMKNGKPFFSKSDDSSIHSPRNDSMSPPLAGQDDLESNNDVSDNSDDGGNVSTSGTNMKLREDTISNALKAYLTDPARVSYVVNWLKASCNALSQPGTSEEELNHLIQIGELTIPALEQLLRRAGVTNTETLHKVLTTYSPRSDEEEEEVNTEEGSNEIKSKGNKVTNSKERSSKGKDDDFAQNAQIPRLTAEAFSPKSMLSNPNLYAYYYNQYAAAYSAAAANNHNHGAAIDTSDKKTRRKRDRDVTTTVTNPSLTTTFPYTTDPNYAMYYPNYVYSYSDYLNHPSAATMRMPSYQDYINAMYLQQNALLPNPMMPHTTESMYDPMYLRQVNQWMASRSRHNSEDIEAYQMALQQAQAAATAAAKALASCTTNSNKTTSLLPPPPPLSSTHHSSGKTDSKSPVATVVTPTAMVEKSGDDKIITSHAISLQDVPPIKKLKSSDDIQEPLKSPTKKSKPVSSGPKKPKAPKETKTTTTPTVESIEAAEGTSVEFAAEALLGLLGR